MIKKENFDKTSAWPFVEAKKLLRERKSFIEKKGKIVLQTGYGPSGLPHIGTFGEVARTSMMVNALKYLTDLPSEIITFSDDMDGLRKVPENIPNKELLEKKFIIKRKQKDGRSYWLSLSEKFFQTFAVSNEYLSNIGSDNNKQR